MAGSANGEVPPCLAALMQPLFCKLCDTRLNSPFQASAHYAGKIHKKKVEHFLKHTTVTQESVDGLASVVLYSPPETLPDANVKKADVSPDKDSNAELVGLYCKTCGITFNSETQAQQHYNGRNHKRRAKGESPLPKGFYDATTDTWTRMPPETASNNMIDNSTIGDKSQCVVCTTCNCSVTSQSQMDMHLAGAKHRAKAAMLEKRNINVNPFGDEPEKLMNGQYDMDNDEFTLSDVMVSHAEPDEDYSEKKFCPSTSEEDLSMYRTPSGMLYCSQCNFNMTSASEFAQHFSSKRHLNRGNVRRNAKKKGKKPKHFGPSLQSD